MLAELVHHAIGVDPDRDWITLAVVDAHTTGIIAHDRFPATAAGYADAVEFVDAYSVDTERVWAVEGTPDRPELRDGRGAGGFGDGRRRRPGRRSVSSPGPVLRVATVADLDAIAEVMRASVLELFPRFYDERQTASAAVHIAHVDPTLVADGTYFVHDLDGEIVACGGWSRRGRLYTGSDDQEGDARLLDPATEAAHIRAMFVRPDWTRRGLGRAILEASHDAARSEGFQRLDLGATLPGVALYRAFGFREVEPFVVTMPDGVTIGAVAMERSTDSL